MRDLLTKTAIISLLYFLLSVLVLNVFDEPSLSAAIWPAAGVGVGAVLLWGNLFLWWTGDAVGVLLFTPLMLLFFAKPRRIWRPRLMPVAIPIVVVLGLMVLLLQVVRNQEERRIVDMLKIKTTYLARALEQKLNWQSELLYLYKSHFPLNGHRPSDSESFRRFSRRAMTRFPQLKELIWVQSANAEEFTPGQTPVFTGLDDHQSAFSAYGDSIETLKQALRIGSNEKHEGIFARNVMPVPGLPGDFVSMLSIYHR